MFLMTDRSEAGRVDAAAADVWRDWCNRMDAIAPSRKHTPMTKEDYKDIALETLMRAAGDFSDAYVNNHDARLDAARLSLGGLRLLAEQMIGPGERNSFFKLMAPIEALFDALGDVGDRVPVGWLSPPRGAPSRSTQEQRDFRKWCVRLVQLLVAGDVRPGKARERVSAALEGAAARIELPMSERALRLWEDNHRKAIAESETERDAERASKNRRSKHRESDIWLDEMRWKICIHNAVSLAQFPMVSGKMKCAAKGIGPSRKAELDRIEANALLNLAETIATDMIGGPRYEEGQGNEIVEVRVNLRNDPPRRRRAGRG